MTVCNFKYESTLVDIEDSSRESDGSIFEASSTDQALMNNYLKLPRPFQFRRN